MPKRKEVYVPTLTARETEILKLICDEKSTIEIGEELGLSISTVTGYRYNIMNKLRVPSVVGMVKFAVKQGIYKL